MTSSYIWFGIVAGVFAAGLGMGYVIFQQSTHFNDMMLNPQQMQHMMNDPRTMSQWQQMMMDNPEAMNQWMQEPQHVRQMTQLMKQNHDFMQEMMMEMINDPNIRLQMLGHMTEDQEAMEQMRMMVNGTDQLDHMMNP